MSCYVQVHLFDIDIPGKVTFQESLTLTAGSSLTTFDTRKYQETDSYILYL